MGRGFSAAALQGSVLVFVCKSMEGLVQNMAMQFHKRILLPVEELMAKFFLEGWERKPKGILRFCRKEAG